MTKKEINKFLINNIDELAQKLIEKVNSDRNQSKHFITYYLVYKENMDLNLNQFKFTNSYQYSEDQILEISYNDVDKEYLKMFDIFSTIAVSEQVYKLAFKKVLEKKIKNRR